MKKTSTVTIGTRMISIVVEGDSAADVTDGFTAALRDATTAMTKRQPIHEIRRHKTATVMLNVDPGSGTDDVIQVNSAGGIVSVAAEHRSEVES